MISIITTSYNYNEYISETIKSVLAQTYSDWELIIVDDASTDNSVDTIKQYCNDKRIKLICHDKNKGLKKSIETALKYCSGEWISFLESDDSFALNTLEERIKHLNKANVIFNAVNLIGDEDWIKDTKKQVLKTEKFLSKFNFPCNIFKSFKSFNPILTLSSVMIKKDLLMNNFMNSPVDALFDWWLYINLSYKNDFYYIPNKLTNWRIHSNSYIKNPTRKKFVLVNVLAYYNIFKQNPMLHLFLLTVDCFFCMLFIRLKIYLIKIIRYIKSLLGLKKKNSPLFD